MISSWKFVRLCKKVGCFLPKCSFFTTLSAFHLAWEPIDNATDWRQDFVVRTVFTLVERCRMGPDLAPAVCQRKWETANMVSYVGLFQLLSGCEIEKWLHSHSCHFHLKWNISLQFSSTFFSWILCPTLLSNAIWKCSRQFLGTYQVKQLKLHPNVFKDKKISVLYKQGRVPMSTLKHFAETHVNSHSSTTDVRLWLFSLGDEWYAALLIAPEILKRLRHAWNINSFSLRSSRLNISLYCCTSGVRDVAWEGKDSRVNRDAGPEW